MGMLDIKRLEKEQARLAKRVVRSDDLPEIRTVAGCDIAYTGNSVVCSVVVMDYETLKIRETKTRTGSARFPYIPGLLSYREAPIIIDTYHDLELDPDIILVDGNGILHPRRIGLASHLGLSLDKPTVGIAKKLLCGEIIKDNILIGKEPVGRVLRTKDISNPIYVSQGHRISLATAVEIVKKTLADHKLPEPLHEAHKHANKQRRKIKIRPES